MYAVFAVIHTIDIVKKQNILYFSGRMSLSSVNFIGPNRYTTYQIHEPVLSGRGQMHVARPEIFESRGL